MNEFLIVTHNGRFIVQFELNDIQILQSIGFEVHCATNFEGENMRADARATLEHMGVICHQISIERSPFKFEQNFKAYCELKELMKQHNFSGVHCHTPMGGVVGRLAAKANKLQSVIYTAHGFHFYKGCPIRNKLLYKTVEKFLARYTDAQITINHEDYEAAKKFPLRGKAYYIPGIGIDIKKISNIKVDRKAKRKELGATPKDTVYLTVGELIPRKNHETLISAFSEIQNNATQLWICGSGREKENLEKLITKLKLENRVKLLGFRLDIYELLHCADIFVFPSHQEGLPVALMEAMAAGLPCIASRIRGNVDLMPESQYLFEPDDKETLCILMQDAAINSRIKNECIRNAQNLKEYDIQNVTKCMTDIYSSLLI